MLLETFELYLITHNAPRRFIPLTCRRSEVITRAQKALEEARAEACDVEQFGQTLFRLAAH